TRLQGDWSSDVCSSDLVSLERRMISMNKSGSATLLPNPFVFEPCFVAQTEHLIKRTLCAQHDHSLLLDHALVLAPQLVEINDRRSEERRVGKESRCRWV